MRGSSDRKWRPTRSDSCSKHPGGLGGGGGRRGGGGCTTFVGLRSDLFEKKKRRSCTRCRRHTWCGRGNKHVSQTEKRTPCHPHQPRRNNYGGWDEEGGQGNLWSKEALNETDGDGCDDSNIASEKRHIPPAIRSDVPPVPCPMHAIEPTLRV